MRSSSSFAARLRAGDWRARFCSSGQRGRQTGVCGEAGADVAVPAVPAEEMEPCGGCDSCVQVIARTHPDLIT